MEALPAYMSDEDLALWLIWAQTDADRAGIAAHFEECEAEQASEDRARAIEATETRDFTPAPATARVLFPIWHSEAPLETALQVAVARVHLEAA
jgi:hypothetical protein